MASSEPTTLIGALARELGIGHQNHYICLFLQKKKDEATRKVRHEIK